MSKKWGPLHRKQTVDALGRITSVVEDPTIASNDPRLDYLTSYGYSALGDLGSVTQGVQTRTFTYNSVRQMLSAANPESGNIAYTYDLDGNVKTKNPRRHRDDLRLR